MRIVAITLAAAALLAAAAPAGAAQQLRLKRLALSPAPPVASGKSGGLAYLLSATSLRVRRSGEPARAYEVPRGCEPGAIGDGAVALVCPFAATAAAGAAPQVVPLTVVLTERDGALRPLAAPAGVTYSDVHAIGRHWLRVSSYDVPDEVHLVETVWLVNWRDGRRIEWGGSHGHGPPPLAPAEYANLDAREPRRLLCAPLLRDRDADVVERIGAWVLQRGVDVALQRCGRSRAERDWRRRQAVLGRDAFAYLGGRRIVYRDLRRGRRYVRTWPAGPDPRLQMYGRRLVVSHFDRGAGAYRIRLGPRVR